MYIKNNLLIPDWNKKYPDLLSGFTLPFYGNQALTRKSRTNNRTTKENRFFLADTLKVNIKNFFYPHQIHSDIVIKIDKNKKGLGAYSLNNAIKGDACITNEKGILLLVSWADCIPVLLYDPFSKSDWLKYLLTNCINEPLHNNLLSEVGKIRPDLTLLIIKFQIQTR